MKCPHCAHENRTGARFCEECGGSLPRPAERITCPSCGFVNRSGVRFCEECGTRLASSTPQTAQAPSRTSPPRRLAAIRCPSCGFANRPGVRFCEECGTALAARPAPQSAISQPERPRRGMPVWLNAIIRFALSSVSGYAIGKLSILALNAVLQAFG
jgi:uncharacterized membrane protein YvbJ